MNPSSIKAFVLVARDIDEYIANGDEETSGSINVDLSLIDTNLITAGMAALDLLKGYERHGPSIERLLEKIAEAITTQRMGVVLETFDDPND